MLNLLDWLRSRTQLGRTATELYGSIVAQARNPIFYRDFGVADVAEKRYEMIVLHVVLVIGRLKELGPSGDNLARGVTEAFVRDLDGSMRELAVGDMSVPRRVKKAAGGLFDRNRLYGEVLGGSSELSLDDIVSELLFDGESGPHSAAMAQYAKACHAALGRWDGETEKGPPPFAPPSPFRPGTQ